MGLRVYIEMLLMEVRKRGEYMVRLAILRHAGHGILCDCGENAFYVS